MKKHENWTRADTGQLMLDSDGRFHDGVYFNVRGCIFDDILNQSWDITFSVEAFRLDDDVCTAYWISTNYKVSLKGKEATIDEAKAAVDREIERAVKTGLVDERAEADGWTVHRLKPDEVDVTDEQLEEAIQDAVMYTRSRFRSVRVRG